MFRFVSEKRCLAVFTVAVLIPALLLEFACAPIKKHARKTYDDSDLKHKREEIVLESSYAGNCIKKEGISIECEFETVDTCCFREYDEAKRIIVWERTTDSLVWHPLTHVILGTTLAVGGGLMIGLTDREEKDGGIFSMSIPGEWIAGGLMLTLSAFCLIVAMINGARLSDTTEHAGTIWINQWETTRDCNREKLGNTRIDGIFRTSHGGKPWKTMVPLGTTDADGRLTLDMQKILSPAVESGAEIVSLHACVNGSIICEIPVEKTLLYLEAKAAGSEIDP